MAASLYYTVHGEGVIILKMLVSVSGRTYPLTQRTKATDVRNGNYESETEIVDQLRQPVTDSWGGPEGLTLYMR